MIPEKTKKRFAGKTAFVADATSALGRAIVARLASEGADVMAADADETAVRALADNTGSSVRACKLSVTEPESWTTAIDATIAAFGRLDILVTIASKQYPAPKTIAETSLAEFRAVTAHNLDGAFFGLQAALPKMRASGSGGAVVMVSAGKEAAAGHGAKAASTSGVALMMKSAALACTDAKDGIRVNAIEAGAPDGVAAAVAFLASDQASYVTGQVIAIGDTPVAA